jgi:ABC-type antimicrobial peptide transport system permease subunit
MKIPLVYIFRSFKSRKLTTAITIFGLSLVVFVFTAVLMMAYGVNKTLQANGSPDNVIITRKSSTSEITSIIDPDVQNVIKTIPLIKKNQSGQLILSAEPVAIVNLTIKTGGLSNVTIRGVNEPVFELRPQVQLLSGRRFNWGSRELIVGRAVEKKYKNAQLGEKIKIAGGLWTVVGVFSTDGSGFDSEVWGDATQLLAEFNRGSTVSTLTCKLANAQDTANIRKFFESDRRLNQFEPEGEIRYYEKQSEWMAIFIRILGLVITVIFSFGAAIGAMITMYAAVANRTVEIGTFRALGFNRRSILSAFLTESLIIAVIGWVIGVLLAQLLVFQRVSTLNFSSFADLEFGFAVSPSILISSFIFAIFMGFIGGFLPSLRAARMNIVTALRAL